MELRQLLYFVTCARCGSLTTAAEELYTTQPHVSMVIRELEKELGTRLFLRRSNGVELTEAGARVTAKRRTVPFRGARAAGTFAACTDEQQQQHGGYADGVLQRANP